MPKTVQKKKTARNKESKRIGRARRMQVPIPAEQHAVMIVHDPRIPVPIGRAKVAPRAVHLIKGNCHRTLFVGAMRNSA